MIKTLVVILDQAF